MQLCYKYGGVRWRYYAITPSTFTNYQWPLYTATCPASIHYLASLRESSDDVIVVPKKRKTYRFRHWCFTLNNPTGSECSFLEAMVDNKSLCVRYIIFQLERGEEGTPHYQGYVEFTDRMSMSKIHLILGFERIAMYYRRGSREQARDYCKKEDTRIEMWKEFGLWIKSRGQSHILERMIESAQNGVSLDNALDSDFRTVLPRYYRFYEKILALSWKQRAKVQFLTAREALDKNLDLVQKVIALIGLTGTGKTRYVYDQHPFEDIYKWTGGSGSKGSTFFHDYQGEPVILLDDFGKGQLSYRLLLQLTHFYPMRVDTKGDTVYLPWTHVYITSNKDPFRWYPDEDSIDELLRRITTTIQFPPERTREEVVTEIW